MIYHRKHHVIFISMNWTLSIVIKISYICFSHKYKNEWKDNFFDKKVNKSSFYKNTKLFSLHDIDVNKILVSKKESYSTKNSLKYFIGYNDCDVVRPLCILLPQIIGYVKHFDSNKTMSFIVSDNKLLKKYNKI